MGDKAGAQLLPTRCLCVNDGGASVRKCYWEKHETRGGRGNRKERNMHINWLMRTGAGESRPLQKLEWGWGEGVPKWSAKPFLQGSIVCWPWLWKESCLQETACCVASMVACNWSLHVAVLSDVSLLLSPPKKKVLRFALLCFAVRCLGLLSQVWIAGCECFCSLFFPHPAR